MTKVAIMQPYFFPYMGYWQLIKEVDLYVVYDDVNYIKGGWINRNRIISKDTVRYINLPMKGASSNKKINEIVVNQDEMGHTVRVLEENYREAPYFLDAMDIIGEVLEYDSLNIATFLTHSIDVICKWLDINTRILISSELEKDNSLKGKDKVIEICKKIGGNQYINAIGGRELYIKDDFEKEGIELCFIKTKDIVYRQYTDSFIPNLSIIDVMMFNSREDIKRMLGLYDIVCG